jgi:hypothetical protein
MQHAWFWHRDSNNADALAKFLWVTSMIRPAGWSGSADGGSQARQCSANDSGVHQTVRQRRQYKNIIDSLALAGFHDVSAAAVGFVLLEQRFKFFRCH